MMGIEMGLGIIRKFIFLSGLIFCLFISCARPPVHIPPTIPKATKEEIINALKENSIHISSLKSLVRIKLEYREGKKLKKHSFDGALLYQDTGEFRLQAFGFFGRTLFDLLYKPDELTLYIPSSSIAYQGTPHQQGDFKDADIFSIIKEMIIEGGENYDETKFFFKDDVYRPWVYGKEYCYLLKINQQTLLIDKRVIFQDRKVVTEISYQSYRQVEGKLFPTQIKVFLPSRQLTLEFRFESLKVNEKLSANLFTLSLPSDVKKLPLSSLRIDDRDQIFPLIN
jgi:hypothetical protein